MSDLFLQKEKCNRCGYEPLNPRIMLWFTEETGD